MAFAALFLLFETKLICTKSDMRTIRTFSKPNCNFNTDSEAYTDDGLVWRWCSNDAVIDIDICRDYGIPCDRAKQRQARSDQLDELLTAIVPHQPSAEEMFEMRAAFGPGVNVVNVFTGQTHRT